MRKKIIAWGGEVHFHSKFTDFTLQDGRITSIKVEHNGETTEVPTEVLVLAIGHSARDTFKMLKDIGLDMQRKPFAIGVRIEHLQSEINKKIKVKIKKRLNNQTLLL